MRRSSLPSGGSPRSSACTSSRRKETISCDTVRRVVLERGSTYVFVGTPDERRWVEIVRGSLVSRMIRELPGIDIRVVAHRALRDELHQ